VRYDREIKSKAQQELDACNEEDERKMLREIDWRRRKERFLKTSDEKLKFVKIKNKVKAELHLHQLSLENRREKYANYLYNMFLELVYSFVHSIVFYVIYVAEVYDRVPSICYHPGTCYMPIEC